MIEMARGGVRLGIGVAGRRRNMKRENRKKERSKRRVSGLGPGAHHCLMLVNKGRMKIMID